MNKPHEEFLRDSRLWKLEKTERQLAARIFLFSDASDKAISEWKTRWKLQKNQGISFPITYVFQLIQRRKQPVVQRVIPTPQYTAWCLERRFLEGSYDPILFDSPECYRAWSRKYGELGTVLRLYPTVFLAQDAMALKPSGKILALIPAT